MKTRRRVSALCISLLALAPFVVSAWTGPTAAPPGNNVAAPINVSVNDQQKHGWIGLDSLSIFKHLIVTGAASNEPGIGYLNFGATWDSAGYGIRDFNGQMQRKDSGGSWVPFSTFSNGLFVSGATSTFNTYGINLTGGCVSVRGVCIGSSVTSAAGGTGAVQFANGTVFAADATKLFWDDTNNRLGIGTNAPGTALEVAGQVKITGGTPGAGKVLTSDAAGLASWATPSSGTVTAVTASSPLASSGGAAPNISFTGTLALANGGTGATTAAAARTNLGLGSVAVLSTNGNTAQYLRGDGTWTAPGGGVGGAGTTNYVAKFTGASAIGNSSIFDNGTNVGIGTASPTSKLDVAGAVRIGNAGEQCQAMSEGAQRYNSATKQMEYCDGTAWNSFAGGYIQRVNYAAWTTPAAVSCQGAEKVIGGGCSCGGGNASLHTSYPSSDTQWMCECIDPSGSPSPVATAWAICAKIR